MATKVNLSVLFTDLARYGQNGEWQRALKTSNRILQQSPEEPTAFHCKIVCMIQLSQFQEALNAVNRNAKIASDLIFEKAYCLYRLNKTEEALDILNSVGAPSHKIKELKAQVLYRLEKYDECYHVYRDLIKNSQDDYEDERETNLGAVIANMHGTKSPLAKEATVTREHTYELTYNSACSLVAQANYKDAEEKLMNAEDILQFYTCKSCAQLLARIEETKNVQNMALFSEEQYAVLQKLLLFNKACKKTLEEDDIPEDEIDSEVGIIRVQRAYCLQMMGKKEKAAQLYANVLKQKPTDAGLIAVASNNIVTINKDQNVFDSKKKMKAATASGLEHKLTSQQHQIIALNQCLLFMYTNQSDQCKDMIKSLKAKHPDSSEVVLIEAALHCRDKNTNKAIAILEEFTREHKKNTLNVSFTLVQLLLIQGRISQACDVLKSLGDVSYKPGIVSAMVTLYLSIEDKTLAAQTLEEAVEWYKKNRPKSPEVVALWRESANFHLKCGDAEAAARSLEELRKFYPKDMKTLAQLITAYSKFDMKKALIASKDLPPVAEVSKSVDVDLLESAAWSMGAKYFKKAGKPEQSPGTPVSGTVTTQGELIKKRKRKPKKGKLPKNYDPSVDPDPERWLPRRERSTFKKRKDRRTVGIGKGTQGATAGTSDLEPGTKPAPEATTSPRANTTPSPAVAATGPRQQRLQPIQKKKKKKGGKW